jgi:hypothetical protein
LISNHDQFCLLPVFSKLLEIIMYWRLEQHDATFRLNNHILNAWNNKLYIGIFCDLAQAFVCINHETLLYKLKYYSIQDTILDLLLTHLTS